MWQQDMMTAVGINNSIFARNNKTYLFIIYVGRIFLNIKASVIYSKYFVFNI